MAGDFSRGFFTASGFGEYYFVKRQLNRTLLGELSRASTQIDKAVNYPAGVTVFGAYNKAFIDSRNYFVVLSDGYLFDNGAGAERDAGARMGVMDTKTRGRCLRRSSRGRWR